MCFRGVARPPYLDPRFLRVEQLEADIETLHADVKNLEKSLEDRRAAKNDTVSGSQIDENRLRQCTDQIQALSQEIDAKTSELQRLVKSMHKPKRARTTTK